MGGGIAGEVGGAGNAMVKLSGIIGSGVGGAGSARVSGVASIATMGVGVERKKREENVKVSGIAGVGVGGGVGSAMGTGISRGSGRVLTAVTLDCCGTSDEFNIELGASVGAAVGFIF